MRKNDDPVEIEMYMHHETPKAVKVSDDGDEKRSKWLAKSLVKIEHRDKNKKQIVHVTMPEWLAEKEGLI